jgi:predicted outer membrane repeat protein
MTRHVAIAILLLLATAAPALALTITYASTTGDDGNACTDPSAPCRTINGALAKADAIGQPIEVRVARGTYKEFIVFLPGGAYELTLSGSWNAGFTTQSAATPTILKPDKSQSGRIILFVGGSGSSVTATVRHLTVTGAGLTRFDGSAPGAGLLAITEGSMNLTVDHVTFTGNKAGQSGGGGMAVLASDSGMATVDVRDSLFTKNTTKGDGGAVYLETVDGGHIDFTAERVRLDKNKAGGSGGGLFTTFRTFLTSDPGRIDAALSNCFVSRNMAGSGGGVAVNEAATPGSSLALLGCSVAGNKASGAGGGVRVNFTGADTLTAAIRNSILWGNKAGAGDDLSVAALGTATNCTLTASDVGEVDGTCGDGGGNASIDPRFVNASSGNLHLQPTSPVRDLGDCGLGPADDVDGQPRPQGAGCDMGADEIP